MWHNWTRLAAGWLIVTGLCSGALPTAVQAQQGTTGTPAGGQRQGTANTAGQTGQPGLPAAVPLVQAQPNQLPCPFPPLGAEHQEYLQNLLAYWENSTSQIKRFRCRFDRWDYDPVFGPAPDPKTGAMQAATIATGEIKFQDPDKAMYEVTGKWTFQAANPEQGLEAKYVEAGAESSEKWISDGRYTFEFDFNSKQMRKRELPPEMQGKTIADGPIPFIFGAKADKMNERYWIRVITPSEAQERGEYWLEAYPKHRADALDFSRVKVILDEKFLPKAVEVYAADYDDLRNRKSQTYEFKDRKHNETDLNLFKILDRAFYDPAPPRGWQLIEIKLDNNIASGAAGPIPNGGEGVNR